MTRIARGIRVLALIAPCAALPAQEPTPEEALRQKLAEPFLANADWTRDFDEAKERARAGERLILGYFTTTGY